MAILTLRTGDIPQELAEMDPKERTDKLFDSVDHDKDGVISQLEFVDGARMDQYIVKLLQHDQFRF